MKKLFAILMLAFLILAPPLFAVDTGPSAPAFILQAQMPQLDPAVAAVQFGEASAPRSLQLEQLMYFSTAASSPGVLHRSTVRPYLWEIQLPDVWWEVSARPPGYG